MPTLHIQHRLVGTNSGNKIHGVEDLTMVDKFMGRFLLNLSGQ